MTSETTFRFYAELGDFLAPSRRQRDVSYRFTVAPSVKDAIESLGVPHTEVDLVLVDGEPVDLSHRLAGGERVAVYPAFERLDVPGRTRVRPGRPEEVAFVVDGHLGALARYLRLLGFDTRFDPACDDDELAAISAAEERILLTRDRGLLKRRAVELGMFVRDDDPDRQLDDVVRRLRLGPIARPFTRCMTCNGHLEPVDKHLVADQLPRRTRDTVASFQRCRACGQLYWEGSHHPRLVELVTRAAARVARPDQV